MDHGDGDPARDLASAVRANDAADVRRVLERHPGLQGRLDEALPGAAFGSTALLEAVQRRNREAIDVLLHAGAHIDQRSHWWAGGFGVLDQDDPDLAAFLIERGATVDVHAAARLGRIDRLEELLAGDPALVHARGGDGQMPLHFAASIEVAACLLAHGADVDARDIDHESTAAQWMVRDRQVTARYLVERGTQTDILMTAALGDEPRVRQHLRADPGSIRTAVSDRFFPKRDPRSGGSIYIWTLGAHKTAVHVAREFGHDDLAARLIEAAPDGMKLALACETGDTALRDAVLVAHPAIARTLDAEDRARLPAVAQENDLEAVRRMLEAGWPLDARGQHGATALHWAAWHGNLEMAQAIIERGAPLDAVDQDFSGTPAAWAIYSSVQGWHPLTGDYAGVLEALLRAGATPPRPRPGTELSSAIRDVVRRHLND